MRNVSTKTILLLTVLVLFDGYALSRKKRERSRSAANKVSKNKKSKKGAPSSVRMASVIPDMSTGALGGYLKAKVEKVVVFNVGQGNGVIVETENAYWVVDFGSLGAPTFWASSDDVYSLKKVTTAAKNMLSEKNLDIIVVISHPDSDHYNQLAELLGTLIGRIKYWFINPVYDESDLTEFDPTSKSKKSKKRKDFHIDDNRYEISADSIQTQDTANQNIIFLNVPSYDKDKTNANSFILLVKIGGGSKMILSGDATNLTWIALKNQCDTNLEVIRKTKNASQVFPCNLLGDIGYYLAPHHGSETEDSHTLVNHFKPTEGVIFSAPMYSHHNHPTCTAVVTAMNVLRPNIDANKVGKHLIYCENSKDKSAKEILDEFHVTDTTRAFFYTFGNMPEFNNKMLVEEKNHAKLGDKYLGTPRYILAETIMPIWVTGVSGEIVCDSTGCSPSPFLVDEEEDPAPEVDEENLLHFARQKPIKGDGEYIITKFTKEEILEAFKTAIAKVPARKSQ